MATILRLTTFGLALAFFLAFFLDDALLLEDVAVEGVEAGGGVLAGPPPSPWLRLPITHSPASSPRTTTATSQPRGMAARGRRRRSR